MKSANVCLLTSEIPRLLSGDLLPDEVADAESHIAECEICRSAIESLIADTRWWDDARQSLATCATRSLHPANESADAECTPNEHLLELLGPTDDPAMLGRIGVYEIVGILGHGGMGVVFKGYDQALNRFVAIKMLLPHLAASGAARKRFAREAQAAAAVVDDHVMAIHGVSEWMSVPYLVMPYGRGVTLQKRLSQDGPLELREILRIGMQAAKGLEAAHSQGLVHRDVKPANIFLDEGVERVQLMDFGLARAVDDASLTRSGTLAGTPQYMSPEQARAETVDHRSDLYSLGSVLYATCTGHAPFRAESSYSVLRLITDNEPRPIREINPDVPTWLCVIISKLMAKCPEDRFSSAGEVAETLESCLAHVQQPTTTPLPKSIANVSAKLIRRPPVGKFIAAAALVFSLVLAGVLIVLELDKGTLTIESEADDIPIRITQNDEIVDKLSVSKSGKTIRVAAGRYCVEIDGDMDGIEVLGSEIVLKRSDAATVKIAKRVLPANHTSANDEAGIGSLAATPIDPLTFAVDRFNEEMRRKFPDHDQPELTKGELVASASWDELRDDHSAALSGVLSGIAKRHQLLEGWTIHGDYVELPPEATPVRAFQIFLQNDHSGDRFTVRERFIAPLNKVVSAKAHDEKVGGVPLSAAIKRFNASHNRADGKKQPPLTENEVIAAILHIQSERDDHDVSDALFERFQNIALTGHLPEGAELEVIPTFGTEGGSIYTIWSVRVKLLQDEAGREGWTYAFVVRQQFVSVKHGNAGEIHWGTPAANGLQAGVRLSPPMLNYSIGQKIEVELLFRNVLTSSVSATIPNFPDYEVEGHDESGMKLRVLAPAEKIIAGARLEQIGEQTVSLRGKPLVIASQSMGPDETARMFADKDGAVLVFAKAGSFYRLQFTVANFASDAAEPLQSGEIQFAVNDAVEALSAMPAVPSIVVDGSDDQLLRTGRASATPGPFDPARERAEKPQDQELFQGTVVEYPLLKKLQGDWEVTKILDEFSDGLGSFQDRSAAINVTGNLLVVSGVRAKSPQVFAEIPMELRFNEVGKGSPQAVDVLFEPNDTERPCKLPGIIEMDDDRIRFCLRSDCGATDEQRPRHFTGGKFIWLYEAKRSPSRRPLPSDPANAELSRPSAQP